MIYISPNPTSGRETSAQTRVAHFWKIWLVQCSASLSATNKPKRFSRKLKAKRNWSKQHIFSFLENLQWWQNQFSTTTGSADPTQLFLRLQPHGNSRAAIHCFTTMWIFNTAAGVFHVVWMEPLVSSHLRYGDRLLLSYIVTQPAE